MLQRSRRCATEELALYPGWLIRFGSRCITRNRREEKNRGNLTPPFSADTYFEGAYEPSTARRRTPRLFYCRIAYLWRHAGNRRPTIAISVEDRSESVAVGLLAFSNGGARHLGHCFGTRATTVRSAVDDHGHTGVLPVAEFWRGVYSRCPDLRRAAYAASVAAVGSAATRRYIGTVGCKTRNRPSTVCRPQNCNLKLDQYRSTSRPEPRETRLPNTVRCCRI